MTRLDLPCATNDPEWWFPVGTALTASNMRAIAKCGTCPIQAACLADALERGDTWGIYGGTTPAERATIIRTRSIERRSKNADHRDRTDLVRHMADMA